MYRFTNIIDDTIYRVKWSLCTLHKQRLNVQRIRLKIVVKTITLDSVWTQECSSQC